MKEGQPNIENLTIKEIKNFFKDSAKVPYGELLASVFQDFTVSRSRKLDKNKMIGGIEPTRNSPVMVLTNYKEGAAVTLEVFRDRKKAPFIKSDLICYVSPSRLSPAYKFESQYLSLSDEYSDILLKIVAEIKSRYSRASHDRGDGGGAGPY